MKQTKGDKGNVRGKREKVGSEGKRKERIKDVKKVRRNVVSIEKG